MRSQTVGNSPRIFGRKTKEDWIKIRDEIITNPNEVENWKRATELLDERLETRYFRPIEKILKMRVTSGEGFAVMTLICSLVEFLHSIYEGKMFDVEKSKHNTLNNFYFGLGKSTDKFTTFLTIHEPFKSEFEKTFEDSRGQQQTLAKDFYSNVRCGLLHEAATKNNWKIKTYNKNFTPENFIDLTDINEKVIYRDKFFEELKIYLCNYKQKIIDDEKDNNNKSLRDNLCRKLDSLCDFDDLNISWWQS